MRSVLIGGLNEDISRKFGERLGLHDRFPAGFGFIPLRMASFWEEGWEEVSSVVDHSNAVSSVLSANVRLREMVSRCDACIYRTGLWNHLAPDLFGNRSVCGSVASHGDVVGYDLRFFCPERTGACDEDFIVLILSL